MSFWERLSTIAEAISYPILAIIFIIAKIIKRLKPNHWFADFADPIAYVAIFLIAILLCLKSCNPTNSTDPTPTEPSQVTIAINESSLIVEESISASDEPTYIWFGNDKYDGDLNESGQPNDSDGTMWYDNGDIYKGDWVNGERHGHGIYTFSNGAVYDGDYVHDDRDGEGTLYGYTATLCLNGVQTECSGTYVGNFKNDNFTGKATFTFDDNPYNLKKFVGEFKDTQCWDGNYTLNDGSTIKITDGIPIS